MSAILSVRLAFVINLRGRLYNILALPCECVIIIIEHVLFAPKAELIIKQLQNREKSDI